MSSTIRTTDLAIVVAAAILTGATPAVTQQPAACWTGTIGSGVGEQRAVLEFSGDGGQSGLIHRFGGTVETDTLVAIERDGDRLAFQFPSPVGTGPATFEGETEGTALIGTVRVSGGTVPAAFERVDPSMPDPATALIGYWTGGLQQGGNVVLRLGVRLAPAPCGQVIATFDSPDQGATGIPIREVRLIGDSLTIDVAAISGTFRGTLTSIDAASGIWSQGPAIIDMTLERTDSVPVAVRPQLPTPPFPYEAVEVAFENPDDGVTIAGTLTIPEGEGPFPAVMLLTGSGAQDRDETLMGHKPFLVIADYLTRRGIAVLRVDDRGVGGSGGNVFEATIANNVIDALAGIAFLQAQDAIDPNRVGLMGHSEGGWVAPAAAVQSDAIAFIVMLAGPAVQADSLLVAQSHALLTASNAPLIDAQVDMTRRLIDVIRSEPDDERAIAEMRAQMNDWVADLPPAQREELLAMMESPAYTAQLDVQFRSQVTPWFRGLLDFEPDAALAAIQVPALALFGGRDLQVPAEQSVPVLDAIWADHPDATIHTFPELNHLFQHATTGLPTEYAQIEETFAPEALEMIGDWILARFGR